MTLLDLTIDKLYQERAARLRCSHVAVIGIMIMIEDLGGYYHPPHAIISISYLVESDRPQIFKNL